MSSVLVGQVSPLVCVLVIVLKGSVLGLVQALIVPFGAYLFFLLNILRHSSPALSRKKWVPNGVFSVS